MTVMDRQGIVRWLRESDDARLAELWRMADRIRRRHVGGEVHLRGLVEFSNHCIRLCSYCGLRAANRGLKRYRMSEAEIIDCVRQAVALGYGTVVLQSGEDPGVDADRMAALIRRIKAETPLAVTLSLGERTDEELAACAGPGPTGTSCASRPRTGRCTSGSTRRGPARSAIGWRSCGRSGSWATRWGAA